MTGFSSTFPPSEEQFKLWQRLGDAGNDFTAFPEADTHQSIPQCFERQVALSQGRLAFCSVGHGVTYAGLNSRANRIAWAILGSQEKGKNPAALLAGHGASAVAAALGVLKAGRICVPLDPKFPRERTIRILQESGADTLVADDSNVSLAWRLAAGTCRVINLDQLPVGGSEENPGLAVSPDSLAQIIYTSGSTGSPKGVLQTHRNVLRVVRRYTNGLHVGRKDRLTLLASCSVTASVANTFGALLNGACLLSFDPRESSLEELGTWLTQQGATILHCTPSLFRHLAAVLPEGQRFPRLRLIRLGGEPVRLEDVSLFRECFPPGCLLVNGYGASEMSTLWQYCIDHDTEMAEAKVPVGYPLGDADFVLLDEGGRAVEHGEVGEIVLRSRFLSPGYWKEEALTLASFSPDPSDAELRIYRTGDHGYLRPDGCLVHVGRKDFQVKIRGFRVETAEVEAALLETSGVKDAAVVAGKDDRGELILLGFVVADGGQATPEIVAGVRQQLRARLPDYMVPSAIIAVERLPQTPNGKVDRPALTKLPEERDRTVGRPPASWTQFESRLADIWRQILSISHVDVEDHFFDVGGNSLLATQVISRVREAFGVELPMRTVFEAPTLAGMSAAIAEHCMRAPGGAANLPMIKARPTRAVLLDQIEGMGEAELDALLQTELASRVAKREVA